MKGCDNVDDLQIVALYWARSDLAIEETRKKYGHYCYTIAYNILQNVQDAEESESDTYFAAWNTMPPNRPLILSTFLGKITRRISLDKWKSHTAAKRGGGQVPLSLNELMECIPDSKHIDDRLHCEALAALIDSFLRTLPVRERNVFLCRHWYFDSIEEIARQFGLSQGKVRTMLCRTRQKLKVYLEKEGVFL